ncbi:hypothetical protein vseg_002432 [Gypsophila vaccaria]
MGESMEAENAAFWLPKHFLTDDDFLSSTTKSNKDIPGFGSGFGFGSDPFDSPVSSTDNDENNNNIINDDDVSLLSHLTRHLARTSLHDTHPSKHSSSDRSWVYSTSPQSTLTGFGTGWSSTNRSPTGPSRVPSPPLTPELQNDAAWDLLYEAAGQVARLKMNAIAAQLSHNGGLLGVPRHSCGRGGGGGGGFTPANHSLYNKQYEEMNWAHHNNCGNNHHQQRRSCGGALGLPQTAWPPLATRQHHNNNHHNRQTSGVHMRGLYQGGGGGANTRTVGPTMGGGVKRQSAGTGVFLPRRVTTSPPRHHHQHTEFRRKPNVAVEEASLKPHLRYGGAGFTDHDLMMARRNVILGQQRRNLIARNEGNNNGAGAMVGPGHEIRLPSDWTY